MNKQKILQDNGLKTTSARVAVLNLLEKQKNPTDVLFIVENLDNQADQATVYRIVELLTKKGIISRLEFGEGKYRYELQKSHHHHLICENCGKIEDVEGEYIHEIEREIKNEKGFLVRSHSLEFFWIMQELSTLGYILFFTLIGSVFSLIGGVLLLFNEKKTLKYSHFLAAFAAGTLLGTVFFDLLPEAVHEAEHLYSESGMEISIFFWTLFGILSFFLLERFIHWFHHHQHEFADEKVKPTVPLIIAGDSVHNFIDGVVIASTFLVSIPLGIITTLAVAAHEIPQEIGDFGILLHKGMRRKKIILVNFFSALMAIVGALIAYWLGERVEASLPILLSITAGFFIYIAASDLIPEIHHENRRGFAVVETSLMFLGVGTIWIFTILLESFH